MAKTLGYYLVYFLHLFGGGRQRRHPVPDVPIPDLRLDEVTKERPSNCRNDSGDGSSNGHVF